MSDPWKELAHNLKRPNPAAEKLQRSLRLMCDPDADITEPTGDELQTVACQKSGLPVVLGSYLKGDTPEELVASATALKKALGHSLKMAPTADPESEMISKDSAVYREHMEKELFRKLTEDIMTRLR